MLLLLALAACARPADQRLPENGISRPAAAPPYVIRGQERPNWGPGWRAVIEGGDLLLDSPTSAGWYRARLSEPAVVSGRRIYRADGLTLIIENGACGLAGYRAELPDKILFEWDAGRFEACGGPRRPPPADLTNTHWELMKIGNEPAPRGRTPAAIVSFTPNDWIFGTEACNDTGAPVRWIGGRFIWLRNGGGRTDMGCNDEAAMAFGNRFWTLMRNAKSWRVDGERLLIALPDGSLAELRYLL